MIKYCYYNGQIINLSKAVVPIYNLGIVRGYGVFDFFRTHNGRIFHVKEHYDRFKRSLQEVNLKLNISFKEFEAVCYELLKKNNVEEASFRTLMLGGPMTDGLLSVKPDLFILLEKTISPDPFLVKNGVKLITSDYMRPFPISKTTCYIEAAKLEPKKRQAKAFEILFINKGKVLECSTSNICIIKKGIYYFPKDNVLKGITQSVVMSLLKKNSHKVIEKEISVKELQNADEVFITATNKKVLPIINIDGKKISNGKVGEYTKIAGQLFDDYIKNYK